MANPTTDPPTLTFPPTAPHTHTIIFLHGRGDTAPNFARSLAYSPLSNAQTLPIALPGFKWVFPSANVMKLAISPAHTNSQWFDVWDVTNFSDREELQAEGLRGSVDRIRRYVI
jgi:predicted esterase